MTNMTSTSPSSAEWVGVSDAAEAAGVAAQTVRNWIAAGTLKTRTGQGPRGERAEVNLAEVRKLTAGSSRTSTRRPSRTTKATKPKATRAKKSAGRSTAPRRAAARATAPTTVTASQPAAPTRSAAVESSANESREQLNALQQRVEQLEVALRQLRQEPPPRRGFFRH
ncbi:MAG TPA: hypothetical protein VNG13_14190 [Mycobacteriales bacterium]|nr:hypothetical protein [Mycobacteriales bacterium]